MTARRLLTFDNLSTAVLVCCAVTLTAFTLKDRFAVKPSVGEPIEIEEWKEYAVGSKRFGAEDPKVTITVFSDFQCPFCAELQQTVEVALQSYREEVGVVFRHSPLTRIHPFAVAAARASECAAKAGHFKAYHDILFEKQTLIPGLDWTATASAVGIVDTSSFSRCLESAETSLALTTDSIAAARLRVNGTPTVLINRWRIEGAPTSAMLDSLISLELRRGVD